MTSAARASDEVLRVGISGRRFAAVGAATIEGAARELGFDDADVDRIGRATLVACETVAERSFDDPDQVSFDVSLWEGPAALTVRIEDHGLPFSLVADGVAAELTTRLLADPVDAVRVRHRDEGDSVELELRSPTESIVVGVDEDEVTTDPVAADAVITTRMLRREDCESLARCVWRVYGYSYVAHYLYDPDAVWSMVERGQLRSAVGLDEAGDVVGHVGLLLDGPGQQVGDTSLALTDPRYRHHHVMESVGSCLVESVGDLGLVGTFVEAVTTHTITQRSTIRQGGVETGVLLGFIPATMSYRGFAEDLGGNRQSAVLGYQSLRPTGHRRVVLPEHYREVLTLLYGRLGLDREVVVGSPADAAADLGPTRVSVEADAPRALATIVIHRAGSDLVEVVERHRAALCRQGMEIVYLEAPLESPVVAAAVGGLRNHGFFYAGVIPELRDGDVLRLQYLDIEVDPSPIQLYTDEARHLLDLILADRP